jgi:hypothetical protein
MDQYTVKMASSFLEELSEIEKRAFVGGLGRMITGGVKILGRLGAKGAQKATLPGLWRHGRMAYGKAGGGWKGLKAMGAAPIGQAAGTAGLGGLAAYGGYKTVAG